VEAGPSLLPAPRLCAARMFHDLLVLQTGGYLNLQQLHSYGDVRILRGPKLAFTS